MSGLEKGVFTLSLDFELIWGTLDLFGPDRFRKACERERKEIIDRLLNLLAEFKLPATWCILGHLFLEGCSAAGDQKHPEIVRPTHSWCNQDWFSNDPGGDETTNPIFFGRSLIRKIQNCRVPQEIGSHSFSHVIFGDRGCSRAAAESEIAACVQAARDMGIELGSFAFPRNEVGHLDVLREYGFIRYRGPEPTWYQKDGWPDLLRRLAHLADVLFVTTPLVFLPERDGNGLWNIAGSMVYFPMHGVRRFIPVSLRVRRAIKGLEAAARQRRIFHLWFHPTNLANRTDDMFHGLRTILQHAQRLQESDKLVFASMGQLASLATRPRGQCLPTVV